MSWWRRPAAPALVLCSLLALSLAGCVQEPAAAQIETVEDHGYVRIWMDPPAGFPAHQVREFNAVPRLIAFVLPPEDQTNETGPGFTDIAKGWDAKNETHGEFDWTKTRLWYEGHVLVGNYSTVRVEVVDTTMVFYSGEEGNVQIQGGRMSFAATDDKPFVVEEGDELDLRFQAAMEQDGPRSFLVK